MKKSQLLSSELRIIELEKKLSSMANFGRSYRVNKTNYYCQSFYTEKRGTEHGQSVVTDGWLAWQPECCHTTVTKHDFRLQLTPLWDNQRCCKTQWMEDDHPAVTDTHCGKTSNPTERVAGAECYDKDDLPAKSGTRERLDLELFFNVLRFVSYLHRWLNCYQPNEDGSKCSLCVMSVPQHAEWACIYFTQCLSIKLSSPRFALTPLSNNTCMSCTYMQTKHLRSWEPVWEQSGPNKTWITWGGDSSEKHFSILHRDLWVMSVQARMDTLAWNTCLHMLYLHVNTFAADFRWWWIFRCFVTFDTTLDHLSWSYHVQTLLYLLQGTSNRYPNRAPQSTILYCFTVCGQITVFNLKTCTDL